MRGFVVVSYVISIYYAIPDIPGRILHSPQNSPFHVQHRIFNLKFAFGPRNECGILRFSVFQNSLFNRSVAPGYA